MLKKFYAKCIQSDPLGRLIVGQVYECEAWQGKTLIHGACIMDSKTFWEHFEPVEEVSNDTRIVRVTMDISEALAKQCAAHDNDAEEHCSKLLKLAINEALRLHNDNNDNESVD